MGAFHKVEAAPLRFIACILSNLLLPMIYVMLLPLDIEADEARLAASGVVDVDIALRVLYFLLSPKEQMELLRLWKWRVLRHLFEYARHHAWAEKLVKVCCPKQAHLARSAGRSA